MWLLHAPPVLTPCPWLLPVRWEKTRKGMEEAAISWPQSDKSIAPGQGEQLPAAGQTGAHH